MKPSIFQLVDKPRVTKNIFQLNKEFNFPGELSLEIDNNIKVIKMFEEDKNAIVVLNLTFFKGRIFEEIPFKLEIEIEGLLPPLVIPLMNFREQNQTK